MAAAFPAMVELLPHAPPMVLLDEVVAASDDGVVAAVTIRPEMPFCGEGGMPAHVGLEYMAQAIGAFAGLQARRAGRPVRLGFLLGSRRYRSDRDRFAIGDRLLVAATRSFDDGQMASFDCAIRIDGAVAATAQVNVYQPDDPALLEQDHGGAG